MLKTQIIGHLGRDAVVQQHGTESVISFSVAHTDRFKKGDGSMMQKTTWINCSWWTEKHAVAQYLKKGVQVYIEGVPEAKMWTGKDKEKQCGLHCRVYSLQLVGGPKQPDQQPRTEDSPRSADGYKPVDVPSDEDFSDLPF